MTTISDPREFLADTRRAVNRVLDDWCLRIRAEMDPKIADAMAYSLSGPGKRLRPALLIAVYGELDGGADVTEIATAVEVARWLKLSKGMVHKLVNEGEIPSRRFGKAVRIPMSWLAHVGQINHPGKRKERR